MGVVIHITSMWELYALKGGYCQKYSMKYIYSTSQMSKLSLILYTFSITSLVAGLFLTYIRLTCDEHTLEPSMLLYISCDHIIVIVTCVTVTTITYDIMLNPNLKFQINEKRNENEKRNKIKKSLLSLTLTVKN